jgi:hypothetical protein
MQRTAFTISIRQRMSIKCVEMENITIRLFWFCPGSGIIKERTHVVIVKRINA